MQDYDYDDSLVPFTLTYSFEYFDLIFSALIKMW